MDCWDMETHREKGRRTLAGYSPAELEVIVDFLAVSIDLQLKHTSRLQNSTAGAR